MYIKTSLKTLKLLLQTCLIFLILLGNNQALAGELSEHLNKFPQWEKLTSVKLPEGDLLYPDWMAGTWKVTSTLIDLAAPLAPDIVTPGFESNRSQLNVPISFVVRFIKVKTSNYPLRIIPPIQNNLLRNDSEILVADRAFNSLNITRAYLGDETVLAVKIDPQSPNRQITFLRHERQLVSHVIGRATETSIDGKFITAEVFQQLFKGGSVPYFNTVESTTAYSQVPNSHAGITADQVTSVYLSPQDPDYFKAGLHPVALYRYHLKFAKLRSLEEY
ncbi:hypothetical protein H6F32_07670 [Anabaena sp. FACHB-1237]|uniref:DUF6816 family protein n=1 Tax=Anabaena sp. FACHB-1237 TaxID=2692769 RepID=UPI0016819C7E|nr:hypothetical protein [Anabaena sp. FACHB-1237]MBD2137465.1 hypothetical protein [Anabaena sp. FACHB-1237]